MKHMTRAVPKEYKYSEIAEFLNDEQENECGIGNNTVAYWIDSPEDPDGPRIGVRLYDTQIAILYSSGNTVQIFTEDWLTKTTKQRIDKCLLPLGYRLFSNNKGHGRARWGNNVAEFKLYSIRTGAYRDFVEGMIVERGRF